jgi:hypothetical protein
MLAKAAAALLLVLTIALLAAGEAQAQDDGPKVYQPTPNGAQSLTVFAVAKRGNETPEPGSIDVGSDIDTDLVVFRYARAFNVAGRQLTPFVIVPFGEAKNTTRQPGQTTSISSSGLGDVQVGATLGLVGSPSLSGEDFAMFRPGFRAALLGRIYLPTGEYSAQSPLNLGANRFSYQAGLATAVAFGSSYLDPSLTALEILPTVTFYQSNDDPYGAGRSSKDPLFSVEAHLTRNLSRKVWLSADVLYRRGGETTTDGTGDRNGMHGWSAGGSLAFPFTDRMNVIFSYVHVVERSDDGPDGWFFRTAIVAPF